MSWLKKITSALGKSSTNIKQGISTLFTNKKLDDTTLEELEDMLIMSDMGIESSSSIIKSIKSEKFDKDITIEDVKKIIASKISDILTPAEANINLMEDKTNVILLCGVNGNGKTTTAGKLAMKYRESGKKVMLVGCDTFRAAATDQLKVWCERSGATFVSGVAKQDPASVAYESVSRAYDEKYDLVLIDTAGRLQNKVDLMNELGKVKRVLKKIDDSLPHMSVLVVDATTGQNAISQIDAFHSSINLDGLIVTKLDGTAKGGIMVAIGSKYKLPIYAIGVGEKIGDLGPFNARTFAESLVY